MRCEALYRFILHHQTHEEDAANRWFERKNTVTTTLHALTKALVSSCNITAQYVLAEYDQRRLSITHQEEYLCLITVYTSNLLYIRDL